MDLYREEILDHYKHPRNFGHFPKPDKRATHENVSCGDKIHMEVLLQGAAKTEDAVVADVRFSGAGCAISVASASLLTERIKGMKISSIRKLGRKDIEKYLGTTLMPARIKCGVLSLEVLQKAIMP